MGRGARYSCECGLFEHLGILCCHIIRLMIRFNVQSIPEAHILTRWTRNAKDVTPEHLKELQKKKPTTEPLSIWQSQLNTKALEVVTKGNSDRETIAVVLKHLKAASKELDDILRARSNIDASESPEQCHLDRATDIEEISGNKYGASGSSAGLSDTEILNIKAPLVVRKGGRPRVKRLRSEADVASKKLSKRVKNSGLPRQSSFCSKCGKSGHNRNRCDSVCSKCGLNDHTDKDCLVVDTEASFFK